MDEKNEVGKKKKSNKHQGTENGKKLLSLALFCYLQLARMTDSVSPMDVAFVILHIIVQNRSEQPISG